MLNGAVQVKSPAEGEKLSDWISYWMRRLIDPWKTTMMKTCQLPAAVVCFPTAICLHCSATCLPTSPCGGTVNPSWPLHLSACPTCICMNWGTCGRSSSTWPWGLLWPCRSDWGSRWVKLRTTTSDRTSKCSKKKKTLKSWATLWQFCSVFCPNSMEPQTSAWTWRNFSPYRIIFGSFSLPSIICTSANLLLLCFLFFLSVQSFLALFAVIAGGVFENNVTLSTIFILLNSFEWYPSIFLYFRNSTKPWRHCSVLS